MAKRILVVDDSATSLVLNQIAITRRSPHQVLTASSGPEALKLAVSMKPDLILMDVMMAGMDGLEVCRRLRSEIATSKIPIVLLTYLSEGESAQRGFECGCDAYLSKPVESAKLIETLNKYLEGQ